MATQTAQVPTTTGTDLQEIRIVSHSNLFYWWPVWAVGLVMALLTWVDGHLMAIVPPHAEVLHGARVEAEVQPGKMDVYRSRTVLLAPEGKDFSQPYLHVA